MDHIETWPNLYIKNKTYISIPWDFNNKKQLNKILENPEKLKNIAEFGNTNYMNYLNNGDDSIFVKYFENLVKDIIN